MNTADSMNFAAVQHTPDTIYAYPVNLNTLRIRLKTAKNDCIQVVIRFKNIYDHVASPSSKVMSLVASDKFNDYFETEITVPERRFKYFFELTDKQGLRWDFSYSGFSAYDERYNEYFFYPYLFEEDIPFPPKWAREGMIYQIFIDRFYNGDKSNDPPKCKLWSELPDRGSFFGGDFKGITERMEYISSLGASMIYVNPIFLSESNHKYDTIDYYIIDPAFGTVDDACEMVREAHRYGIRVILDAVFNHCSNKNQIFLEVVEKGEQSEFYDWFSINGPRVETSPHNYDSFACLVPAMPRLNTSNPAVQDYLIDSAVHWTKTLDIDGWRLDVADEVSHVFWKKFRTKIKSVKPDIFILGEAWNRATPWLLGDEFDSVTNYKFRNALLKMASDDSHTSEDFWDEVIRNEMNYRSDTIPYMVNLVSSHDVKRVITALDGNKAAVRLVFGVTFCYQGIPLLYYGDEIGLEGGEDPDNRRTMKWDETDQDTELLAFIRKLGNFRRTSEKLSYGTVSPIRNLSPRVIGFERGADYKDRILVFANFGRSDAIIHTERYKGGSDIKLGGYEFLVLNSEG